MADPERADDGSAAQLVRVAAALRWSRPDLTAALAELALDTARDVDARVGAAGWLLHGRAALGDGRETASDLLDALSPPDVAGTDPTVGPAAGRLRVELAGVARRAEQRDVARALLSASLEADDVELRADALTEVARCTVDEAADRTEDALRSADQAWQTAGCATGAASVLLLRAGRDRQVGRADSAASWAVRGLGLLGNRDRGYRPSASDHLVAALTAEWIAALVAAGRLEQARTEALPAAHRLLATVRPSRPVAGLRLAVARVVAVTGVPEGVVTAVEGAAQDAARSDVPQLESACRLLLGELHGSAGRLDEALAAVRAAMAAERRDRDRERRVRTCFGTLATGRPATPSLVGAAPMPPAPSGSRQVGGATEADGHGLELADRQRHRHPDPSPALDGLGMADLLAGALVAYRSLCDQA